MKRFYALLLVFVLLAGALFGCARDKNNKNERSSEDIAAAPENSASADVNPSANTDIGTSIENMLPHPNDGEVENGHAADGNVDDGKSPDKNGTNDRYTEENTGTSDSTVNDTGR